MVSFIVAACFGMGFILSFSFVKFVYLPIVNVRERRRVNQDIHALPPSGHSPFVEIDIHEVNNNETQVNTENNENTGNTGNTENIILNTDLSLTSPPETSYASERKISIDISSIHENKKPIIPIKTDSLFHTTTVIIN